MGSRVKGVTQSGEQGEDVTQRTVCGVREAMTGNLSIPPGCVTPDIICWSFFFQMTDSSQARSVAQGSLVG